MPNPVDTMISKIKGVIKPIEGLQGVFRTIAQQHREISALLKRLQEHPDKRPELWPEVRRELLSHERAEMRVVFPVLREHTATRAHAEHHDTEADEMEDLIDEIDSQAIGWRPLFDKLVHAVLRHAEEEEKVIFPVAQEVIGKVAAEDLDQRFLAAKGQVTDA